MATEVKIRKVRAITFSGVRTGPQEDGKCARVMTVRSEDGHIYNITLVSDRVEWLMIDEGGRTRRSRHHGGLEDKEARGCAAERALPPPATLIATRSRSVKV